MPLTHLAVKLRNQCDAVIGAALNDGKDPLSNGELWLIQRLRGQIRHFIDVGANIGDWTKLVLANEPTAVGLCYEPAPSALSTLLPRARDWRGVRVLPKAVADRAGHMQFLDFGAASEVSGEASVVSDGGGGTLLTVPTVTLDEECAAFGWTDVDLVKIDAEGSDWRVLRGAEAYLRKGRFRVIQFEYGPYWVRSGGTLSSTIGFLESCGYSVSRLRGWGRSPVESTTYGEYFGYSNFVATRKGEEEVLGPERGGEAG